MHGSKKLKKLETQVAVVQQKLDELGPPADDESVISDMVLLNVAYPAGCPSVTDLAFRHDLSRRQVRRVHSSAALLFLREQALAMQAALDKSRCVGVQVFVDALKWDETLQSFCLGRDGLSRTQATKK